MISIYLIAAIGVLLAVIAALIYKNKADNSKHEAEKQKTVAAAVKVEIDHDHILNQQLEQLHEAQRNETIIERSQLNRRTDFDNDWCNGVLGTGANSPADSGATAASAPDPAGHQVERSDLSD